MNEYPESETPAMPEGEQPTEAQEQESSLIPKSLWPGAKVGDVMPMKVISIIDDEIEVAPDEGGEKPAESAKEGDSMESRMMAMAEA